MQLRDRIKNYARTPDVQELPSLIEVQLASFKWFWCDSMGADLLLKGAYTQSRLRQMIFGGATRDILAHAELPVLFAN